MRREISDGQESRGKAAKTGCEAEGQTVGETFQSCFDATRMTRPSGFERAEKWPIVKALVSVELWDRGIGYLLIARQESEGRLIIAVFLVDVYCLGVKNAFWHAGTHEDLEDLIRQTEKVQMMCAITPSCLAKIVKGAVEYAQSFGFPPHPDYRPCLASARWDRSLDVPEPILVRPRRQAFLHPRAQRVVRTGHGNQPTHPRGGRTLPRRDTRCRFARFSNDGRCI